MVLPIAAILILPADVERTAIDRAIRESMIVPRLDLGGDHVETDAFDTRRRPGEIAVDHIPVEPDRLENLGAAIALSRGNAHLGHHLHDALGRRLDKVLDRLLGVDVLSRPCSIMSSSVSKAR